MVGPGWNNRWVTWQTDVRWGEVWLPPSLSSSVFVRAVCWLNSERDGNEIWTRVTTNRSSLIEAQRAVTALLAFCLHLHHVPADRWSSTIRSEYSRYMNTQHVPYTRVYICTHTSTFQRWSTRFDRQRLVDVGESAIINYTVNQTAAWMINGVN